MNLFNDPDGPYQHCSGLEIGFQICFDYEITDDLDSNPSHGRRGFLSFKNAKGVTPGEHACLACFSVEDEEKLNSGERGVAMCWNGNDMVAGVNTWTDYATVRATSATKFTKAS